MNIEYNDRRWRNIKFLFGLALIGAIIALVVFNYRETSNLQPIKRTRVFEEFELGLLDKTARIRITIPESSFQIIKDANGTWVMPERDNFPIDIEKLRRLETDIKYLYKLDLRTTDPSQFDRLGVGEPKEFGEGTSIEFFDASGQVITGSNIGQIGNLIFIRELGALEVYSASGQLMDISQRSNWLDFRFLKIPKAAIAKISIKQKDKREYEIINGDDGRFRLMNGEIGPRIDSVANFISKMEPNNLVQSNRISVSPLLVQTILLNDKNTIIVGVYKQNGAYWVKLEPMITNAPSQFVSDELIEKAKIWAFGVSSETAEALLHSKEELAIRGTLH